MKAKITILPKPSVLDPQGSAVAAALAQMGHGEVAGTRVGRYIELELGRDTPQVREGVRQACRDFLSNPVIEDFELVFE